MFRKLKEEEGSLVEGQILLVWVTCGCQNSMPFAVCQAAKRLSRDDLQSLLRARTETDNGANGMNDANHGDNQGNDEANEGRQKRACKVSSWTEGLTCSQDATGALQRACVWT